MHKRNIAQNKTNLLPGEFPLHVAEDWYPLLTTRVVLEDRLQSSGSQIELELFLCSTQSVHPLTDRDMGRAVKQS